MNFRAPDLPAARVAGAHAPRPGLSPFAADDAADAPRLAAGRVHEVTGSARAAFAVVLAGHVRQDGPQGRAQGGPVLWIRPAWSPERLHPDGMRPFADPGRFLFVDAPRDADILWCMEEALRSGQVALVVADLPAVPGLTAVRRLTLAAEAGATGSGRAGSAGHGGVGGVGPTGLILTPGAGGAPGVETRWRMNAAHAADPAHGAEGAPAADGTGWRLERLRARMVPPAVFRIAPGTGGSLRVDPDRPAGAA